MMKANIQVKRYNIYSCLSLKVDEQEWCFDPAKIRKEDIDAFNPDYIFISHESMDHMDPIQVYNLQKKKNCKVFCSIAAAIDLSQYYSHDTTFVDSLQVLIPGSSVQSDGLFIETVKSIHCDYMLPIVLKITSLNSGFSLIHCFDSHLSEEIVKLSEKTDVGIIPIGIAKGVSPISGKGFAEKLYSQIFITNHFKNERQLNEFNELIRKEKNNSKYLLLNWNESCDIDILPCEKEANFTNALGNKMLSDDDFCNDLLNAEILSLDEIHAFLIKLNQKKCKLLQNKDLLNKLYSSYLNLSEDKKKVILIIFIMISLIDPYLLIDQLIIDIQSDFSSPISDENNSLQVMALCFMGVYVQQIAKCHGINHLDSLLGKGSEHLDYWIVEFLGRSATSKGIDYLKAVDILKRKVIENEKLYNSVVVRRKIFWELYRIMKHIPHVANQFLRFFEDGLNDSNPDVRLLAILCFGLANRTMDLSCEQIDNIIKLFDDDEDDVRETALSELRMFAKNYWDQIWNEKRKIESMLQDHNCHVQLAAKELLEILSRKLTVAKQGVEL